jgi:threonine dehydratase
VNVRTDGSGQDAAVARNAVWPITFEDVRRAAERLRPHLTPTPLRRYPALDAWVGHGVRVWVKHENHQPTNAFKARNGMSALSALSPEARARGVVAATRGNHGAGLAWAGAELGVPVTVCVPLGNNPEKNDAVRALGATLVEEGRDYDESVAVAERLTRELGLTLIHSTGNRDVIAGAGTMTLEMLTQVPELEALVLSVGGGSQAVGGMVSARALKPGLPVYGVQAAGASAIHDSWHSGRPEPKASAATFADGLATRNVYEMTFGALQDGLAGFVAVTEAELAEAVRAALRVTHNLVEGAGAAGLAGLRRVAPELEGRNVGVVFSGGNIDAETLGRVLSGQL